MKLWRDVGVAIQGGLDDAVEADRCELSHWRVRRTAQPTVTERRSVSAPISPDYVLSVIALSSVAPMTPTTPFPGSRLQRWPVLAPFEWPPR